MPLCRTSWSDQRWSTDPQVDDNGRRTRLVIQTSGSTGARRNPADRLASPLREVGHPLSTPIPLFLVYLVAITRLEVRPGISSSVDACGKQRTTGTAWRYSSGRAHEEPHHWRAGRGGRVSVICRSRHGVETNQPPAVAQYIYVGHPVSCQCR